MSRGDIPSAINMRVMKFTEDGTAAITKGDLCIMRVGKIKKITAVSDTGPYVVAVEDIAKSGSGRVAMPGTVVEMDEGNDSAVTAGDILIPSGTTLGDVKKGTTADFSATYVQSEVKALKLIVGMALEDISQDGTGSVLLGCFSGKSD